MANGNQDISTSLALIKPTIKTAIAQALFNEIVYNTNGYYYFIGRTLEWSPLVDAVLTPQASAQYENETRERMIFLKKVTAADMSFTIPRYDWASGEVFDMYDDQLGKEVSVTVDPVGANFSILSGTFDPQEIGIGWLVEGDGIDINTRVTNVTPTQVSISERTIGNVENVKFINVASSGVANQESSRFYVITNEQHVYKCLFNNKGEPSTVKPFSTTHEPIYTEDGYIWKYMYTIPGALINKFTTLDDIPVATAVKAAYYSQGAINSVTLQSYGSGYQQGDILVVNGDGHRQGNVYRLISITIDNAGFGYTESPTITVDDPFDTTLFQPETSYIQGQYVKAGQRIYEVLQGGISGEDAPIHSSREPIPNGTTSMSFVGLAVDATAEIEDGQVTAVTTTGIIGFIYLDGVGSGYNPEVPPEVIIEGDGEGATAVASVSSAGYISAITIVSRGSGYTNATVTIAPPDEGVTAVARAEIDFGFGYSVIPAVRASDPFEADVEWSIGGEVDEGDIVTYGDKFYEVTSTGTGQILGAVPPQHTTGTSTNGEVDLEYIGQTATLSMFTERTRAVIIPIIEGGQIVNVVVQDPGVAYSVATVEAFGAGEGAILTANLSIGDLNTRQANNELLAVPGSIEVIDVMNPGLNYIWATVAVEGDGEGCEATAVIEDGQLVRINVTNAGQNYTKARVIITGNESATPAYARAIVSPFDGHGHDAIAELYAKDITMSTTIARDRNQGFIVENDYRQLGIIKNPQQYTSALRFNGFTGSACHVITGSFVYGDIENDMIITDTEGNEYRVVAKPLEEPPEGDPVSLLVQSIDNTDPVSGTVMLYGDNQQAIIVYVTVPTVNKYSGTMLFIDNRASFQPTTEQTVSIKTVIRL